MPLKLFIIAGPNGSGKSLFSVYLVDADYEVFDGDKQISRLKLKFPEIGSDVLENTVNEHDFKIAKQKAIDSKGNFAFETNFSSDDPTYSMREFKHAGFETHLIFIGLESLEESIQRVSNRVSEGGHKVSEESIRYNYEHGFANLYKHYEEFDSVTLLNNPISTEDPLGIPKRLLFWERGKLQFVENSLPKWVQKFRRLCSVKPAK